MAQGVNGNAFFTHAGLQLGTEKGTLNTTFGHRIEGILCDCSASAKSWEEKLGMAVNSPIAAEQMTRRLRQRDIEVLGTLAALDMDHPALTVDIGDFEIKA